MPSLQQILMDTLPFAAGEFNHSDMRNNADLYRRDPPGSATMPPPPMPSPFPPGSLATDARIWSWSFDIARPNVFSNVQCNIRTMGAMAMAVCDKVEFGFARHGLPLEPRVRVAQAGTGDDLSLPLNSRFLVRQHVIDDDPVLPAPAFRSGRGTNFWPLETHLDVSMLLVFAYEFVGGDDPFVVPSNDAMGSHDFMPSPNAASTAGRMFVPGFYGNEIGPSWIEWAWGLARNLDEYASRAANGRVYRR